MDPDWKTLSRDPDRLTDAVLELHHAAQVVAAAGQAFAEPADDDGHRTLTWDRHMDILVGAAWAPGYPFRVSLDPVRYDLAIHERDGTVLGSFALGGRTLADAYGWLEDAVRTYTGGARAARVEAPDFRIPDHPVGEGRSFSLERTQERTDVAGLFRAAFSVLEELTSDRPDAAPVRLWPHHFDVGTVLPLPEPSGPDPARTVGVGMAPMGGGHETWYWYVNTWPPLEAPPSGAPPHGGVWHMDGWSGAALPAAAVRDEGRPAVTRFLAEAVASLTRAAAEATVDPPEG